MQTISIFGSTGSIGKNTLDVIRKNKKDFNVLGLCAFANLTALKQQIKEFKPKYVCVVNEDKASELEDYFENKVKILKGERGLEEFSSLKTDMSLMAIAGMSALKPLLLNLKHTKKIALANKESIVCAGSFVFNEAKKHNTQIIPVDSEINGFFQLFDKQQKSANKINKLYITASGGALFDFNVHNCKNISVDTVLAHPTWRMGRRITVDCATLVNKGFEVIEAHKFFNIPYSDINVVIHRESLIHAMVEFQDKSVLACMYPADMRIPISFALFYPRRVKCVNGIDFTGKINFSFQPVDFKQFPLLKIVLEAAGKEDNALVILNACDEVAIDYFLNKKIKFNQIQKTIEYVLSYYQSAKIKNIKEVFYWDAWARIKTKEYLDKLC